MPDAWGGSFGSDTCNSVTGVCGTTKYVGPKPGDPDNESILSAVPAYGGIDVSFTYPATNPHALAYTLLYRGITNSFELATLRTVVSGNFFYDRIPKEEIKEYFYWIQFVSVNATTGDPIGPASAVPMSSIAETIQDLTGLIDAGVLAESLKTEIARIGTIDNSLAQEVLNRLGANNVLTDAMAELQNETGQVMTIILDEVNQRTTADDAMITSVNALIAGINGDYAAVVAQQSVLVDADEALAESVLTAQSVLNGNIASVQTTLQTNINAVDGEVTNLGALYTAKVDVNGLIGGFGVYNDGTTVEAGFDVDRFWIGRTTNKAKPFIIDNGVVYINEAAIQKLTFSKLRDEAGAFVVANGKVKAAYIEADQLLVGANQVSGLGALAALGSVTVGSNIKFGDGTTLSQGDFVNRLSKIGSGNISTFLDGAAITNAYLGNASVDTLKVAGNSVTTSAIHNYIVGTIAGISSVAAQFISSPMIVNFPYGAQAVIFIITVTASVWGNSTSVGVRVRRDDGVVVFSTGVGAKEDWITSHTVSGADQSPLTGTHSYTLEHFNNHSAGYWSGSSSVVVLGTLR